MNELTAGAASDNLRLNKYLIPAMILAVVILVSFLAYGAQKKPATAVVPAGRKVISQGMLEEQYGLRVNLVAVTAAGGLVDVRLRIVDGEKARSLLDSPDKFPALQVANGAILNAHPDTKAQEIGFEDNSNLYVLFPNARNVVKPGTPVTVVFGDTTLEPIIAR